MPIQFICPHCGLLLQVDDAHAGKTCICKSCREDVVVPVPYSEDNDILSTSESELTKPLDTAQIKIDENYPRFWQAIGLLLIYISLYLINSLFFYALMYIIFPSLKANKLIDSIVWAIAAFLVLLYSSRRTGQLISIYFKPIKLNFRAILYMLVGAIGFKLFISSLSLMLYVIIPEFHNSIGRLGTNYLTEFNSGIMTTLIRVVIIAPISEEFLFRGIILRGFLRNYSPMQAIILSSLIFGILHLNPLQVISAFLIGVLLGVIYYKTKSVYSCIFCHIILNLTVMASKLQTYYTSWGPYETIKDSYMILASVILYAIGFTLAAYGLVKLIRLKTASN